MTTEECLEALTQGKTLINNMGGEVHLDNFGYQVHKNAGASRKGRDFRFSHPELWQIKEPTMQKETNWLIALGVMLVLSLGLNMALYQAYNEVVTSPSEIAELNVSLEETTKLYEETLVKLRKYEATEENLKSLGASSIEAQRAMLAAKVYNLDPKFLEH